jgi:hypothetical protein
MRKPNEPVAEHLGCFKIETLGSDSFAVSLRLPVQIGIIQREDRERLPQLPAFAWALA